MSFSEILDGFVYLALKYPSEKLAPLYNRYAEYLRTYENVCDVQDFVTIIKAAESAREYDDYEKNIIINNTSYIPLGA